MSGKPKYIQIEDSILNQIKGGILRPGDQIPTEAELCDTFQVSRTIWSIISPASGPAMT